MTSDLALLVFAALPLMGSPGPATLSLAGMGAAHGVAGSLRYAAGVNAGTVAVVVLIATGVTAVVLGLPGVKPAAMVLAGAYMLYLAWRIATAPPVSAPISAHERRSRVPSFFGGFVLAIANPKAYAAIGAVYASSLIEAGEDIDAEVAKVLVLSGIAIAVNAAWLALGATISGILRDPAKARVTNLVFAFLLLVSVAFAAF